MTPIHCIASVLCAGALSCAELPVHCRVVDFGGDLGDGIYRDHACREIAREGATVVSGWAWDGARPLSPSQPHYRAERTSSLFLGGVVGFQSKGLITEGMINANHSLRDDFNLMSAQSQEARKPGFSVRAYATFLWPKQGFLNGGDAHRVAFDARTRMAVHISRYWDDIDGLRYVVRDRAGLWISEQIFGADKAGKKQFSPVLDPSATRWAAYAPAAPAAIAFDAAGAAFAARAFDDVQAVGFHLFRDRGGPGVVAVKWNAFALHATVHRPQRPGWNVDLRPVGSLLAQEREVSFALWRRIQEWSARNQWCWDLEEGGYAYRGDGEIAGQRDGRPHAASEPVARIAWIDAVAWCNALSEFEGLTPAYYVDDARSRVLRRTCERDTPAAASDLQVWLRADADGYRLPTPAEHQRLRAAGFAGIADGPGEWLWEGGVDAPLDDRRHAPASGALPETGLRVVRGAPDTAPAEIPLSLLRPVVAAEKPPGLADADLARVAGGRFARADDTEAMLSDFHMARTETSFALWNRVRIWAEANGYRFDRPGDLGSAAWGDPDRRHHPEEPVTMVGWHDAVAWCNALSELEGRTPCYYEDRELARPYRRASAWRIAMCGRTLQNSMRDEVFVRWGADGYRLPTHAEWSAAYRAGDGAKLPNDGFPASAPASGAAARGWFADSSGGATHPVGTRPANALGLHDLDGNVMEWTWDNPATDPLRTRNPKGARNGLFGMPLLGGCFAGGPEGIGPRAGIQEQESAARATAGFRVVRCAADAHSAADDRPPVVLRLDPATFDPLPGRTFRGGLARTGAYPVSGLPALSGVAWTLQTGGPVRSSPVAADGVLVVGSDDGMVYAVDPATGSERWRFAAGGAVQASATIAGGRVYIGSTSGFLHALDLSDGRELWRWANDPANPKQFPITNSTALAYGVLFVGVNGWSPRSNLVGLDPATGTEVWRCRAAKPNDGPMAPTVLDGRIIFPGNDNILFCVDLATTDVLWKGAGNHCQASVPATADGLFYDAADACFRMDAAGGRILNRSAPAPGGALSYFPHASPAVHAGVAVFAKQDGVLRAFRATDFQKPLWEARLGAQLNSSPAIAGGLVYVGCDDGHVYAVGLADGAVRWKHRTGGPVLSSPLPGDGCVYVGSDDGTLAMLR